MKIFVTGGSGFIGKQLVNYLLRDNHQISLLTRHPRESNHPNVRYIRGDLSKLETLTADLLKDCDVIFNCAGEVKDVNKMRALHVDGVAYLLELARAEAKRRERPIHFVQLSSVGAYGPPRYIREKRIVVETTPENPQGKYEVTKVEGDHSVIRAAEPGVLSYSILRPSNVFGPSMTNMSLRNLVRLLRSGLFCYIGPRDSICTYVHVDDVVEALALCGFHPHAKGEIFNISSDCLWTELIQSLSEELGVRAPRIRIPTWLAQIALILCFFMPRFPLSKSRINAFVGRTTYSIEKIESVLGYQLKRRTIASIRDMIETS